FTAHCTSTYIWPASHQAGSCSSAFPPMGARFRLKAGFNITSFAPTTQVVLRAFQHYGMVLADNGSDWFFSGTTDDWWGTTAGSQVISELKTIPAAQFDAVDESGLQAAAGSYQATSATNTRCTGITASAAPATPQLSGTVVTLSASASGCPSPRYQFWILPPGGAWTVVQAYSSTTTFTWNTMHDPAASYLWTVWARDASSSANLDTYFPGTNYTLTTQPCTVVTASATPASPQTVGAVVTLSATASGCPNPQYQFWILPPGGKW